MFLRMSSGSLTLKKEKKKRLIGLWFALARLNLDLVIKVKQKSTTDILLNNVKLKIKKRQ
jgi:hypothetical protein